MRCMEQLHGLTSKQEGAHLIEELALGGDLNLLVAEQRLVQVHTGGSIIAKAFADVCW